MKNKIIIIPNLILISLLLLFQSGCSSRNAEPIIREDSTVVYPPKQPDGLIAKITLCKKVGKTGNRIGAGTDFTIKDKARIYAFFDFKNQENFTNKDIMFHVEWIGPDGKSFYRKRIDLSPDTNSSSLKSSISISPEKREPGSYLIRLFLFRELIAEKKFQLSDFVPISEKEFNISANITLFRKIGKKTGKKIGEGTVFTIKKKAKVRAIVDLGNLDEYLEDELKFSVKWSGPNSKSFYTKKFLLSPEENSATIKSSITITPGKRQPGNYIFRVYLYKTLLAEKKFELR